MALDDNALRLTVSADVSPLIAGMNQATAAVSTSADKMAASFGTATAASTSTTAAMGGTRSAMGAARLEIGALEGSTRSMALGLEHVAAESKIVGPLLQAAFLPFAAIAVGAILEQAYEAFGKLSDSVMGYSEEVQKAEKEDVKFSTAALEHAQSLTEAEDNLRDTLEALGSTGATSYLQDFDAAVKANTSSTWNYIEPIGELVKAYEGVAHAESDVADAALHMTQAARAEEIEIMNQDVALHRQALGIAREKASADEAGLTTAAQRTRVEIDALKTEEKLQEDIAAEEAGIKAAKEGGNAAAAQEAARAAVQEEFYLKEIALAQRQVVEGYQKSFEAFEHFEAGLRKFDEGTAGLMAGELANAKKDAEEIGRLAGQLAEEGAKFQSETEEAEVRHQVAMVNAAIAAAEARESAQSKGISGAQWMTEPDKQKAQLAVVTEQYAAEKAAIDPVVASLEAEQAAIQQSAMSDDEKASGVARLQSQIDALIAKLTALKAKMDELGQDNWPVQLGNKINTSFGQIDSRINSSLNQWVTGHKTFQQSMYQMWSGLAQEAIMNLLKITEKTVEQLLIRKATTIATEQATVAAHGAAAAESATISKASAFQEQLAYAKAGAVKAYNALASIPYVGPELGAVAAAGAFALLLAFQKGGIMPYDAPAYLHAGEMVLPERISTFVQQQAAAPTLAGAGAGSGDMHMHINALDARSFQDFFQRNSGAAMKMAKGMFRDGWRPR